MVMINVGVERRGCGSQRATGQRLGVMSPVFLPVFCLLPYIEGLALTRFFWCWPIVLFLCFSLSVLASVYDLVRYGVCDKGMWQRWY